MKTNAVRLLESLGIQYELREYEVDPDDLAAETVAAKIGMAPEQVFKTLLRVATVMVCALPWSRPILSLISRRWPQPPATGRWSWFR
jgi:prolyl-tRNA editing enzyme YbaK/EbsC (Cys-tRNA(Pro) deacylase)